MNRTKRRIFNTALKLFAEKGYDSTSVEEITAISGVAKGTLYYHFSNKEEILDLLLTEGMKLLRNSIEIKMKKCNNSIEKIKSIVMVQIKVTVKYENLITLVFNQMWGKEEKNIKCRNSVSEYLKILEDVIEEGIRNNELREGNPKALACEIFGVTYSSLTYKAVTNSQENVDELYNSFINTVIEGIVRKA